MWKQMRKMKVLLSIILCSFVCMPMAVKAVDVSSGNINLEETVSSGDQTVSEGNVDETEIIKVVLPTNFAVLMYEEPGVEGMYIQSQDILVINKSNCPVNVKVKDIKYEVTEKMMRSTESNELNVLIKEFQKEEYSVSFMEENFTPFYISLDEERAETNAEQLLKKAEGWNPIGPVQNPDYSILRLSGMISDANIREQDVEIGIVFEFERAQDGEN